MKRIIFLLFTMSINMHGADNYGVVLAGGVGERLWPLSRQHHPKQFLPLGSARCLVGQSIDRLQLFLESNNIWAVTAAKHADQMRTSIGGQVGTILVEPEGRNTAPAILYTCFELAKVNPEAVVLFVPADPFIPSYDYEKFSQYAQHAMEFARSHDKIILLGVKPTYPAIGYGYIEYVFEEKQSVFSVSRFHEKPSLKLAEGYMQQSNMLWNIGMFGGKVSMFLNEFKNINPELYEQVENFVSGVSSYADIDSISVDFALIEKSNNVAVLPVDFSWCDVGNVHVFLSIEEQFKQLKKPIEIDAHNNLVHVPNKTVAVIGVDDLCVVETEDALLITKKCDAEKVRNVVKNLKENNRRELL